MLAKKIKANGIGVLWYGGVATMTATFVGHYPWCAPLNPKLNTGVLP
jgi:hypothetical protein